MKKIFCILSVLTILSPVLADDEPGVEPETPQTPTVYQTSAATASYVQGAYDALNSAKQNLLTQQNVVTTGSGSVVTSVSATNGAVSVTTGEVTIPTSQPSGSVPNGRAILWVQ